MNVVLRRFVLKYIHVNKTRLNMRTEICPYVLIHKICVVIKIKSKSGKSEFQCRPHTALGPARR